MSDFGQLPEIPFDPSVPGRFDPEALLCAEDEFFNVSTLTCEPLVPGGPGPGGAPFPTVPIPGVPDPGASPFPTVPIPVGPPCGQQLADMEMNLFACETRVMTYAVVAGVAGVLVGVTLGRLL
jgi:hypothetical protein